MLIIVLFVAIVIPAFSIKGYKNVPSKNGCSLEKCLDHCVNHKKICSIWDEKGYVSIYYQVLNLNKNRFVDANKIRVGDSVIFPPFECANIMIGKKTILIVKKNESLWSLVHRYLGENYLFILDSSHRGVTYGIRIPKTKSMVFGSTTILW